MATPTSVPLATPPVFTRATPAGTEPVIATPDAGEDIVATPGEATPDVPVVTAEATPDAGTPPVVATPDAVIVANESTPEVPVVTEVASPAATPDSDLPYGQLGNQAGAAALEAVTDVLGEDTVATPVN